MIALGTQKNKQKTFTNNFTYINSQNVNYSVSWS